MLPGHSPEFDFSAIASFRSRCDRSRISAGPGIHFPCCGRGFLGRGFSGLRSCNLDIVENKGFRSPNAGGRNMPLLIL